MESKLALRKRLIKIRSAIKPSYREEASRLAAKHFLTLPFLREKLNIACYLPTKYEFDPASIIDIIWKTKCNCYLPVLEEAESKQLTFVHYQYGVALKPNRFGILEPIKRDQMINPQELDLVITPLIAFDVDCHRLGTGGGYYDTTFNFLQAGYTKKPYFLGLGYAAQQADHVPIDPWDLNMDAILTEKGLVRPFR